MYFSFWKTNHISSSPDTASWQHRHQHVVTKQLSQTITSTASNTTVWHTCIHYLVGTTELLTMIDYQLISVSVFIQRTHIHRPTQSEAWRKDPCYLICGSSDDSKATATTPLMHVPCSSNALERSISAQLRSNCLWAFCYKTEHSSTQWSWDL